MKYTKLKMFWSKREKDTMIEHPMGIHTNADAAFLWSFFKDGFREELEERGYDWATVKFEISPKLPSDKFPTLSKDKR